MSHRYAYNYGHRHWRVCPCMSLLPIYYKREYKQCLPLISLMVYLRDALSSTGSNWVWIMDTGLKSSKGKTMREVLLDVIEAFPKYDLESAEGTNKAIEEMEEKLGEVAIFKERIVIPPNRSCISRFAIA